MPKMTRDDLFKRALADFLDEFNVSTNDGVIRQYSIQTYTLTNSTKNKTQVVHDYTLTIPKEIIIAYRDITHSRDADEEMWEDSEPIYTQHEVPLLNDFVKSFNTHFDPYRLYVQNVLMSYIRVSHNTRNLPISSAPINIQVIYHKAHTPYPRPLTELEEKDNEIQYLSGKNLSNTKKIKTLRNILSNERIKAEHNYKRMQRMLRKQYAESNIRTDCPVCLEEICPDKLIIPGCCHSICVTCVVNCVTCPLCREEYDAYIENELYS